VSAVHAGCSKFSYDIVFFFYFLRPVNPSASMHVVVGRIVRLCCFALSPSQLHGFAVLAKIDFEKTLMAFQIFPAFLVA
jgi:hypothetical protein